jgi:tRNA wybutosine-synthesizing protein 2
MLAVRIRKEHSESVRRALWEEGLIDPVRRIQRSGEYVEIPILQGKELPLEEIPYTVIRQRSPLPQRRKTPSFERVKEILEEELGLDMAPLRGGWERIGDILILQLPDSLLASGRAVGERLLSLFPGVRVVVHRWGVQDVFRRPRTEVLACRGRGGTETLHKENGCLFRLDPAQVMFSAGNLGERRRMASLAAEGETVVDLFAGVGQLSIPLAKHSGAERVYAIEKNPVAYRYLQENVRLNRLEGMTPLLGDCRDVAPEGVADRVLMGYLFRTEEFLPTALRVLKRSGILHFHTLGEKKGLHRQGEEILASLRDLGREGRVVGTEIVKSYAPGRWHVVFDLEVL